MRKKMYHYLFILMDFWRKDKISTYSASLAYFTLFALTPLIIICTSIIGLIFGHDFAEQQVLDLITLIIGADSANEIQTMINHAHHLPLSGVTAEVIGFIVLFIGASGIFIQIQLGLNEIWGQQEIPNEGTFTFIKNRFLSFVMVLGVSFLLLVSLLLSLFFTILSDYMGSVFYSQTFASIHFLVSVVVIS